MRCWHHVTLQCDLPRTFRRRHLSSSKYRCISSWLSHVFWRRATPINHDADHRLGRQPVPDEDRGSSSTSSPLVLFLRPASGQSLFDSGLGPFLFQKTRVRLFYFHCFRLLFRCGSMNFHLARQVNRPSKFWLGQQEWCTWARITA